jgi:hypothetical protein
MDRHELAWAAGFFDGEGWAAKKKRGVQARINQADDRGVPAALIRFQSALAGLGAIAGPHRKPERRDLYSWTVSSRCDVALLFSLLRPWLGLVKLLQFAAATGGVAPVHANIAAKDDVWRAWAAGFFDGEGSSYLLKHRTHPGYLVGELAVTQSSLVGPPEVLRRFAAVVGAGYIAGPFTQRSATKDVYRWKAGARVDVERVVAELWPWLGEVKRVQAQRMLDVVRAQPELPRGNPAWGNRKTHCINGHEYATSRMRPYVARGVGIPPRENQSCLVCLRDYARKQRETRRSAADDGRRSISDPAQIYLLK